MTLRLQNLMLAMLLALATLFVGFGTLSQNPTSGGYQLFERVASGISADIQLASLENFAPPPETASEYANATNRLPVPDRRVEITELFDNTNPRSGIQIGNRTVLNDPTNTGGARVFSDVSDVEVRNYFTELTGQPLPAPRTVNIGGRNVQLYTVRTPDGNFNLRSGSSSVLPNGQAPSWTIDVPGGATGRVDSRGRPVTSELKFE